MRKVIIVLLFSVLVSSCGPMKGIETSEVSDSNAIQSHGPTSSATSSSPEPNVDTTTAEEYFREKNRKTLARLQGVQVIVEDFKPEAEKYGFNRQQYQTDVELRLRQYGIKVLSQKERHQVSGMPMLYINVNPLIDEKMGDAAVSYSVQLMEYVLLERNPSIRTFATTWDKSGTRLCGLKRLDGVRERVRDLVDQFINDYLAANPKDSTTKTIQQTYVVPKNALLDMITCADIFRWVSDPNFPQEKRVVVHKNSSFLLAMQRVYLEDKFGLGEEDISARRRVLLMGLSDKTPGLFDYLE